MVVRVIGVWRLRKVEVLVLDNVRRFWIKSDLGFLRVGAD